MGNGVQALAERFRTCSVTGIKIDRKAELLIKVNAVVAVVCFLIGILAAIGLVLTRAKGV